MKFVMIFTMTEWIFTALPPWTQTIFVSTSVVTDFVSIIEISVVISA